MGHHPKVDAGGLAAGSQIILQEFKIEAVGSSCTGRRLGNSERRIPVSVSLVGLKDSLYTVIY